MKRALALVGTFLLVSIVKCKEPLFLKEMTECAHSLGISQDEMMSMVASKDEKLGCVDACVMDKIGGMVDGKLNMAALMEALEKYKEHFKDPEMAKTNIHTCFDQTKDLSKCEAAGKFALCMHESM